MTRLVELSPLSTSMDEYGAEHVSYLRDVLPVLQIAYCTTTYYSYRNYHRMSYTLNKDFATAMVQKNSADLEIQSKRSLRNMHHAQEQLQKAAQEDRQKLSGKYLALKSNAQRIESRRQLTLRHDVQEHTENIPHYTLEISQRLVQMMPEVFENFQQRADGTRTYRSIDPHVIRIALESIFYTLQGMETHYSLNFGYNTLDNAIKDEPYLQALLKYYTIHEIFTLHEQYFEQITGNAAVEDESFQAIIKTVQQKIPDAFDYLTHMVLYETLAQRYIMRSIYTAPEVADYLDTAPLEWLVQSVDIEGVRQQAQEYINAQLREDFLA